MPPKLLSIITITYNAESTIDHTLRSVEMQTCAERIEHIIVDGASTDSTLAKVTDYKLRNADRQIKVVSEPDKGLYDAMNKGLHLATGNYVCFLNSGDRLHATTTIESIETQLQKCRFGVIYGDTDIVDNDGRFLRRRHLVPPEQLTWRSFKQGMLVCHQSFYACRDLCPDYDLKYRFSADVDWCIRVMRKGESMGLNNYNTHQVLTDYLDGGLTTRKHRASLIERFKVMTHHYGLLTTIIRHITFLWRSKR